jgi:hypothetical protein
VQNAAWGPSDLLKGSFSFSGESSAFANDGFGEFSGLDAGGADGGLSVTLNTSQAGTFSETITLNPTGYNDAIGYSRSLSPETLTVTGTVMADETICFMAGTRIRTPDGEVAVEMLRRGDLVLTAEGSEKPVAWLGRQTISSRFADPVRSWPIRVKASAFGENVPARDLLVSPDHALLVEDVLIHAGALVNGTSIVRETRVPEVFVYYHVELDDHALILAENTPAETFIDNVERLAFDNWAEHEALYPDGKPIDEMPQRHGHDAVDDGDHRAGVQEIRHGCVYREPDAGRSGLDRHRRHGRGGRPHVYSGLEQDQPRTKSAKAANCLPKNSFVPASVKSPVAVSLLP